MFVFARISVGVFFVLSLIACAHKKKSCSPSDAHEPPETTLSKNETSNLNPAEEIASKGAAEFVNSSALNPEQKQKIMLIYSRVYMDAASIRKEILQAKSEIFKMIANLKHNSKEINTLKNKIIRLDKQRLDIMFKALKDVQDVVGYGPDKEDIYRHFYDFEIPRYKNMSKF